jgi:hypothetical protein
MRLFPNRKSTPQQKWGLWRWYDIILDDELYLRRLNIIKTPWFGVKLHWILKEDPDRHLHTHPWCFVSLVLRGGYEELESQNPQREAGKLKTINWFNFKNLVTAHRIITVKPKTLTLIISGPRLQSWGFYHHKTFQYADWRDYERLDLSHQWD